jgi:salicylate hydroxylase
MKILMVGGGIGGLVAAIALAQRDFEVEILEQQADPREVGAGIAIAGNGRRVLSSLGVDASLASLGHSASGVRLRSGKSGRVIAESRADPSLASRFGGLPYNLHRGDLRRVLMDAALACPTVRFHLGQRVTSISQEPDGVSVETVQGMRATGDALIGADGIHSVVRRAIAGPDAPRFSGEVVWRALVPRDRLPGAASAEFTTIWTGRDRHFLHYLVRRGELLNIGGFVESEEWRSESWTLPGKKADFARLFAGFHIVVRDIIDAADECFVQAIHEREPLAAWFKGRAVLLGDACHAMPPHLGQGAGMAIEDAVVLARALADHRRDLDGAFRSYQTKRKERVERVAAAVRKFGRIYNVGHPIRGAVLHTLMRLMSKIRPAAGPFDWVLEYDALSS